MRYKMFLFVTFLALLQGCQWLARTETERHFELALADDRACRDEGYRWPGDAYVECRRFRADARQRELWQEVQLSRGRQSDFGMSPSPGDTYRPIRASDYRCEQRRTSDGEAWIDCREQD